ncbi:MAG: hypothetical protein HJJLKODD_02586 [Phycisphaerae bacterium]|nr:hypothetical protein [Phycisphaerae bacterium]
MLPNSMNCLYVLSTPVVAALMIPLALFAQEQKVATMKERVQQYAPVQLTADLSRLTDKERQMIPLLLEAAQQMDLIFWQESFGDREALLKSILDPDMRRLVEINYGPWDRLGDNAPFVPGYGAKPLGANYYPQEMTKEMFEAYLQQHPDDREALLNPYTVIRKDALSQLQAVPYHQAYAEPTRIAAEKLKAAAELAEDSGLKKYLELRSVALLTSNYLESDLAWMEMKNNTLDIVIGPIENYEDALFGYKTTHEAYVLIKDQEWSGRLAKYAALLPELQKKLPVPEAYKQESPGSDSDLNAYDVIYYAGDCNAGGKTIAINLPNDERVQLQKGTRRLQLKNAMRAKYDKIMVPIADILIDSSQQQQNTYDAFFQNVMFHEVAHGLGIKNTLGNKGTVREALKEQHSALEECKADILGLYLISQLREQNQLTEGQMADNYVTFLVGIFRSVRFGGASAHGNANMITFNFFSQQGAFSRDAATGRYRADLEKMPIAVAALAEKLITIQGDGNYDAAKKFVEEMSRMPEQLQADLQRINSANIPVDVVFEQGLEYLKLSK